MKRSLKKLAVYAALYAVTAAIIVSAILITPKAQNPIPYVHGFIIFFATALLFKYFIFMMISPWYNPINASSSLKKKRYNPKVSVIVPAYNEAEGVVTTATSLLKNTYRNMEIILVNNASTDNTLKNMKALARTFKKNRPKSKRNVSVVVITETAKGKGHALNTGLKKAKGDIIISIDADCYVTPTAIANMVSVFKDPKVMAAVGNVKIGNTQTIIGVVQYLEFLLSFYFKKGDSAINAIYIIGGAAGAFRREVFKKLGPYSTSNITEDIELSMRIQDAGMKIVYAADAHIFTEGASDLRGLMNQRLRWKRGRMETFIEKRHMFFSRKKSHNKLLTWFVLPFAIFGDIQLFFEPFFLLFLYIYSIHSHDYTSFISGIVVVVSMFIIQLAFDAHRENRFRFMALAPIAWLLFYVAAFVEFSALIRAIVMFISKKEAEWQSWQRTGVLQTK